MIRVTCPQCGEPFWRHGAGESSHFLVPAEQADTCICCREGLDPETLQPRTTPQVRRDVQGTMVGELPDY